MATKTQATHAMLTVEGCAAPRDMVEPGARKMQAFFKRVRAEAKRFAQICDMSPNTIALIADTPSTSLDDCTIFCIEPNDPVERAQVCAAFVHAALLLGGCLFYDAREDVGAMMTIYITLGALP